MSQTKRRDSTLFSPLSIGIALVLLAALGIILWGTGGVTFSPGQVSAKSKPGVSLGNPGGKQFASHAAFEPDCAYCHQPLQGLQVVDQARLCLGCHTEISGQITAKIGTHGLIKDVSRCAYCHKEHQGRAYDPTGEALANFDHNQTHFALDGKHIPLKCSECHHVDAQSPEAFALKGGQCVTCHAEPEVHAGLLGTDCAKCHTSFGWKPAKEPAAAVTTAEKDITQASSASAQPVALFDHTRQFVLIHHQVDYQGKAILCGGCHTSDPQTKTLKTDVQLCQNCHAGHDADFMSKHVTQYGPNCMDCHDGADRLEKFKHANFFLLDGKHTDLACEKCHAKGYRNTLAACADCHAEPDVHTATFGKNCQYCHTTSAWLPASLRMHTFPLDHGTPGTDVDCKTCHPATDTEYTCTSCHDHQIVPIQATHLKLKVTGPALLACSSCHPRGK